MARQPGTSNRVKQAKPKPDSLNSVAFPADIEAVTDVAHAIKPERFGRYVLLDRIGEGGMAEVFRAIMPGAEGFKRTLVVKRILSQLSQSAKFVEMFVREARIGSLLNHPNMALLTAAGMVLGRRIGAGWGRRVEVLGGLVLVGIGVKIVVEHLG